ncbi:MAG: phosphoribosyltransferase family protein [Pseudomonadota bacterium]
MARPPLVVDPFRYEAPIDWLIASLKYNANVTSLPILELAVGNLVDQIDACVSDVCPMPLHPWKRYQRGFNQCDFLARFAAARVGARVRRTWLSKIRRTPPQVGLAQSQRLKNQRGAFVAARDVRGRQILLIDDVMTTGATMMAARAALHAAGASRVLCVALSATAEADR